MAAGSEHARGAPGAIHDQQQLLGERVGVPGPRLRSELAETTDDGSLVLRRSAVPRVVGLGELAGRYSVILATPDSVTIVSTPTA